MEVAVRNHDKKELATLSHSCQQRLSESWTQLSRNSWVPSSIWNLWNLSHVPSGVELSTQFWSTVYHWKVNSNLNQRGMHYL